MVICFCLCFFLVGFFDFSVSSRRPFAVSIQDPCYQLVTLAMPFLPRPCAAAKPKRYPWSGKLTNWTSLTQFGRTARPVPNLAATADQPLRRSAWHPAMSQPTHKTDQVLQETPAWGRRHCVFSQFTCFCVPCRINGSWPWQCGVVPLGVPKKLQLVRPTRRVACFGSSRAGFDSVRCRTLIWFVWMIFLTVFQLTANAPGWLCRQTKWIATMLDLSFVSCRHGHVCCAEPVLFHVPLMHFESWQSQGTRLLNSVDASWAQI